MKSQMAPNKPLQSRHRTVPGLDGSNGPAKVPGMLRRMTKQSFMDIDLAYLMKMDPTTHDPFENSSPVFDDPPSLFRALPAYNGNNEWMSSESIRLQKEQEELRVQYLQFLHQLNLSNPQAFLVHMNTFSREFPQEFAQLQAYIRHQEQIVNEQREQAQREEQMRQYQMQLEMKLHHEQEMQRQQQQYQLQIQQQQAQEMRNLLQEWLLKRQKAKSTSSSLFSQNNKNKAELDLADVFTIALQKDPKLLERMLQPTNNASSPSAFPGVNSGMTSTPSGLEMLLTPAQQQEFSYFLEQKRIQQILSQEESKKRLQQDLTAAGFSPLAFQTALSGLSGSPSSSSNIFGDTSNLFGNDSSFSSSWAAAAAANAAAGSSSSAVYSHFQPPLTNENYLGLKRGGSKKTTNTRRF
ncbi:hypothetical protein EMPS_04180 [Entomortierella parvispora]|uniref:Uncharacterized protein n=1 Tax=Entomortierella parvispora TaxID=205924 RepID=A0A9P3H875_9FUNG|nr:hypothetical protein EMPS_04177 [Entomortierella parvispora]GJJ71823.1 hypothetical protein EMPS_04180 [Entomortierella parvispora]